MNERMEKGKVSKEIASDITNYIIRQRLWWKDEAVRSCVCMIKHGASYSVMHDICENECRYSIGRIQGYYQMALYLDVISHDEYQKLLLDLNCMFDSDLIIESAINRKHCEDIAKEGK